MPLLSYLYLNKLSEATALFDSLTLQDKTILYKSTLYPNILVPRPLYDCTILYQKIKSK